MLPVAVWSGEGRAASSAPLLGAWPQTTELHAEKVGGERGASAWDTLRTQGAQLSPPIPEGLGEARQTWVRILPLRSCVPITRPCVPITQPWFPHLQTGCSHPNLADPLH